MPNGQDDNLLCVDAIDDPVRVVENLAVCRLPDLRNDTSATREAVKRSNPLEQLTEPPGGSLRSILRDGLEGLTRALFGKR